MNSFRLKTSAAVVLTLMAAAIVRTIFGKDENIVVSRNALFWYLTETDWMNRQRFAEAWLYGE